jgi:putative transcriptional regulator
MKGGEFEWRDAKAAENLRNHGIAFDKAVKAFDDPFAIEWIDQSEAYGEERWNLLAMCEGVVLHVTYTSVVSGSGSSRLDGQNDMSKTDTIARMGADGTVVEVLPDGTERPFPEKPMRPMTEAEVHAAALADPDAQPLTEERLARMKRVPRTKTLRRALGLTQEEFAARYQIPIGTLRDWERGRSEPDQPARAYLKVIARDPEGVRRALEWKPAVPE